MTFIMKQENESHGTQLWVLLFLGLFSGYGFTASPVVAAPFAYVANSNDNTVSVIDTTTDTVVPPPIPVGLSPRYVAITPDGTRAYVTNLNDNTVSVIDTTTNTVVPPRSRSVPSPLHWPSLRTGLEPT